MSRRTPIIDAPRYESFGIVREKPKPYREWINYDRIPVRTPDEQAWLDAFLTLTLDQRNAFHHLPFERRIEIGAMAPAAMIALLTTEARSEAA